MNQELETAVLSNIRETYAASIALAESAKGNAKAAIQKAVECGNHLISAKSAVGHGKWMDWCEANLNHGSNLTHKTITKYMALAKFVNEGGSLEDAASQRQAFQVAGILNEPHREHGSQQSHGEASKWLSYIQKAWGELEKIKESRPVADWPQTQRITLKEKLRPLAELYQTL